MTAWSSSSGPQLWCSASRPTAVVVALPGQLPGHGKPGVGLGDLQLSAPQVLLDVDVGPALLSIDLVVECLAKGQRLVPRCMASSQVSSLHSDMAHHPRQVHQDLLA